MGYMKSEQLQEKLKLSKTLNDIRNNMRMCIYYIHGISNSFFFTSSLSAKSFLFLKVNMMFTKHAKPKLKLKNTCTQSKNNYKSSKQFKGQFKVKH